MFVKLETFEEQNNRFFTAMLLDLNPKIYAISTDMFVYQPKSTIITGNVPMSNAEITISINGKTIATTTADGEGKFSSSLDLVDDENNILITYVQGRSRARIIAP